MGRVRHLSRSDCCRGAPDERQDEEEHGEAFLPVHRVPRSAGSFREYHGRAVAPEPPMPFTFSEDATSAALDRGRVRRDQRAGFALALELVVKEGL
jgi:hypothetical protein